jgi:glycosyltransferase involved in cell wall biosynthesis
MTAAPARRRALILVENLPVPFDRRVWQEATALTAAGWRVTVICPKGRGYEAAEEEIEGVRVMRHALPFEARGAVGYLVEYAAALWSQSRLALKVWRSGGFDVIHACNPPDLLFLVALPYRLFARTRFIFDHHDLSPELFEVKFGRRGLFYWALRVAERLTFRMADASIATNETFRDIAIARGRMEPSRVRVVKSYPNLARFQRTAPRQDLKREGEILIGYLGVIGDQDGVDILLRAMAALAGRGRTDLRLMIVGDGSALPACRALADTLGVGDRVLFTGFLSGEALMAHLSAIDIGVIPDPCNAFNDKLSMNKVFEYMALGLPFVQFPLTQAMREAGDCALVVEDEGPEGLAVGILALADDPDRRAAMGAAGRARAMREFDWITQVPALLEAYALAVGERVASAEVKADAAVDEAAVLPTAVR